MRTYELMMILNPQLDAAALTALQKEIKDDLKDVSIKVVSEDNWWARDLAYKIKWSHTGYYCLWQVSTDAPQCVNDITNTFNIKGDLWRYMFTLNEASES